MVEVASLRSETSEVFATPEGELEAREYLRPVRTRISGQWRAIDTDLARTEAGTVVPKATAVGLEFSGGGDAPLARMERAGRTLQLPLPAGHPPPGTA